MKCALLTLSVLVALAAPAAAQGQSADIAAAEVLFRDGQRLRKEGNYEQACPKLAESYRLDPATGSLLALALCYEGQGLFASAWSAYLEAASRARRDGEPDRDRAARDRVRELDGKLSKLTLQVSPEAAQITGLEVRRDGEIVAQAVWSVAVPVDGGEHTVVARAPGHTPWTQTLTIASEGDAKSVQIPPLRPVISAPPAAVSQEPALPSSRADDLPAPISPPAPLERGLSPHQSLALGLAAGGLVGVGVGSYFGLRALNKKQAAEDAGCNEDSVCAGSNGVTLIDQGRSAGNISTYAFIAGGVLLAGAAVVYSLGDGSFSGDTGSNKTGRTKTTGGSAEADRGSTVRVALRWGSLVVDGRF